MTNKERQQAKLLHLETPLSSLKEPSQPREGESLSDSSPQIPTNSKYRSYSHKSLGEVHHKAYCKGAS
ncbi:hypothetical protein A0J61_10312 [Choanephora cucurbitarum]|uniref:Uncharacterized protein n=1 Tax=Choanephora cucurbitarum TaxID=101091 RepID=A0A1C7MZ02_9FUNG|nr:hypothetical protein A0J61_10312 [Choanephora cucurbitarum]